MRAPWIVSLAFCCSTFATPTLFAVEVLRLDFENAANLAEDSSANNFSGMITDTEFNFFGTIGQSTDVPSVSSGTGSANFMPFDFETGQFIEFLAGQFPTFTVDDSFTVSLWAKPSSAYNADGFGFRGLVAGITGSSTANWQIDNGDNVEAGAGDGTLTGARLIGGGNAEIVPEGDIPPDVWTQISVAFVGPARAAVVFVGDESNPLSYSSVAVGTGFAAEGITLGGNRNSTSSNLPDSQPAGRMYEGLMDEVVVHNMALYYNGSGNAFVPGDLDFSGGDPDADDWAAFRGGQGADLSLLEPFDAYAMGDMDFDGDNDVFDFIAFKGVFDAANGAGALDALISSVPEPSTVALAVIGLAGLAGFARRRRSPRTADTSARSTGMKRLRVNTLLIALALLTCAVATPSARAALFDFGNGDFSANNATSDGLSNFTFSVEVDQVSDPLGVRAETIDGVTLTLTPVVGSGFDFAQSFWGSNSQGIGIRSFDSAAANEGGANGNRRRIDGEIGEAVHFSFDRDVTLFDMRFGSFDPAGDGTEEITEISYVSGGSDPFGGTPFTISSGTGTDPDQDHPVNVFVTAGTVLSLSTTTSVGQGILWNGMNVFEGPPPEPLTLQVLSSGEMRLLGGNPGGVSPPPGFDIDYISIASDDVEEDGGSLNPAGFTGLGGEFTTGTGSGDGWEFGENNTDQLIIESFLLGTSLIGNSDDISLGNGYVPGGTQDISFTYHVAGDVGPTTGVVEYVTVAGLPGDFNDDGTVDAADYTVWRDNLGGDSAALNGNGSGSATVVQADYDLWRQSFGNTAASAALGSEAVPEPTAVSIVGAALVGLVLARRSLRPHGVC